MDNIFAVTRSSMGDDAEALDTGSFDLDDIDIKVEHGIELGNNENETVISEDEEEMILNFVSTDEFISNTGRKENENDHEIPEDPLSLTSFIEDEDGDGHSKSELISKTRTRISKSRTKTKKSVKTERPWRSRTKKSSAKKPLSMLVHTCQKCPMDFRTKRELQTHVTKTHPTVKTRVESKSRKSPKAAKPAELPTVRILTFACASCSCKFSSKIGLDIHECTGAVVATVPKSNKTRTKLSSMPSVQPSLDFELRNIPSEPYPEIQIKTEPENECSRSPSPSPQSPIWGNDDDNDSACESQEQSVRPLRKRKDEIKDRSDDQESDPEAPNPKRRRKSEKPADSVRKTAGNRKKKSSKTKTKGKDKKIRKEKTVGPINCKHCEKILPSPEDRESHIKTDHPDIQPMILCDCCPRLFYHNSTYVLHKTAKLLPHPYACEHCDEKFPSRRKLSSHVQSHTESSNTCQHCSKVLLSSELLRSHILRYCKSVPKATYKCPFAGCDAELQTRDKLRDHKRVSHGVRRNIRWIDKGSASLLCNECGKLFTNKNSLHNHERRHLLRFPCDLCEKAFPSRQNLDFHYTIHVPDRPFKCDCCGKTFRSESHLKYHTRRVHEYKNREKAHKCKFCERGFKDKSKLVAHERTHTGEKPIECPVPGCDARFNCSGSRSTHMKYRHGTEKRKDYRTKGGPKIFPCSYCDKKFSSHGSVRCHERTIHAGIADRPLPKFVCKYCQKGFLSQYATDVHQRTHTGEKPFVCQFCTKRFGSKELLAVHLKSHQ